MSRKFLPRITNILTEASGLKLDIFLPFILVASHYEARQMILYLQAYTD